MKCFSRIYPDKNKSKGDHTKNVAITDYYSLEKLKNCLILGREIGKNSREFTVHNLEQPSKIKEYILSFSPYSRTFHAYSHCHQKQKIHADIDITGDMLKHSENITDSFISSLLRVFNELFSGSLEVENILLMTSHGVTKEGKLKKSYHIVIPDYFLENSHSVKFLILLVVQEMPKEYRDFVDMRIYHENGWSCLRCLYSHKLGDKRTLIVGEPKIKSSSFDSDFKEYTWKYMEKDVKYRIEAGDVKEYLVLSIPVMGQNIPVLNIKNYWRNLLLTLESESKDEDLPLDILGEILGKKYNNPIRPILHYLGYPVEKSDKIGNIKYCGSRLTENEKKLINKAMRRIPSIYHQKGYERSILPDSKEEILNVSLGRTGINECSRCNKVHHKREATLTLFENECVILRCRFNKKHTIILQPGGKLKDNEIEYEDLTSQEKELVDKTIKSFREPNKFGITDFDDKYIIKKYFYFHSLNGYKIVELLLIQKGEKCQICGVSQSVKNHHLKLRIRPNGKIAFECLAKI